MNFRSDNEAPVAPEIMAALARVNEGTAAAYGADAVSGGLERVFSALFETEVQVFPVATGTAANSLALAAMTPPFGAVYCHEEAHVALDECGAPEFYTGGAKVTGLPGADGKIDPESLAAAVDRAAAFGVHHVAPAAVSIAQATEAGTVYSVAETEALAAAAHGHGLALHMDGARFANAMATLGCTPAEATWRAGVDILSFGATKNGAMAAEAVVVFRPDLAASLARRRKRAGHLHCKMRYLSAQLEAYVADGLWLALAARANHTARRLADGLAALPGVGLVHPVEANEVFAVLTPAVNEGLIAEGFRFHPWPASENAVRLVTSFATDDAEVDALLATAARHAASSDRKNESQ